jgi:hypothetical protein
MNAEQFHLSSAGWVITVFGVVFILLSILLMVLRDEKSDSFKITVPGSELSISSLGLFVLILGVLLTFGPTLSPLMLDPDKNVMVYRSRPERVLNDPEFYLTSYYDAYVWTTEDFSTQATHTACDRKSKPVTCDIISSCGEMTCLQIGFPDLSSDDNWSWLGVYWLPPDHIRSEKRPTRLANKNYLIFSVKSEYPSSLKYVDFLIGGIYPDKDFHDNFEYDIGTLSLTNEFQKHREFLMDKDLSNLVGAFALKISRSLNPTLNQHDKLYITNPQFY